MGKSYEPPEAPNYGAASREAIEAEVELLPKRLEAEANARLKYDPIFQQQQIDLFRDASPQLAQIALDMQTEYGDEFVEASRRQLEASDPEGFALRQELGSKLLEDLKAGRSLTDEERRESRNNVRGAQLARGNYLGNASAFEELQTMSDAGFRKEQQRMANAGAFLGQPLNAQFQSLSGAQQGAAPVQQVNAGNPFRYMGTDTMQNGAQFASNTFSTQANIYANQPQNPWMSGLGMLTGAVGQAAAGPIGGGIGNWIMGKKG